ncbi:MAG: hypothetical protein JWO14_2205 [Solirubrobacterales bacterium]|nr:hypothetical protein [Solirubrobacterales bacterium]
MTDTIDDARQLIQSRLADISAEARQLERALVGLGEGTVRKRRRGRPRGSAPALVTPPKRKRAPRKPKRAKRAARGQRREELLAAIKANPGARPSALAKEMGVRPTQVSVLIAKARADKLVVKKGNGYALKGKP